MPQKYEINSNNCGKYHKNSQYTVKITHQSVFSVILCGEKDSSASCSRRTIADVVGCKYNSNPLPDCILRVTISLRMAYLYCVFGSAIILAADGLGDSYPSKRHLPSLVATTNTRDCPKRLNGIYIRSVIIMLTAIGFYSGAKVQLIFPDSKFQGYRKRGRTRGRKGYRTADDGKSLIEKLFFA